MQKREPYYLDKDMMAVVQDIPYMRVRGSGLPYLLKNMEAAGRAYAELLPLHPLVSCDPLDFHYRCRRSTNALDEHFLADLLFSYSWREANVGAFLAMLAPKPAYKAPLQQRRESLPYGQDIIDLALAMIDSEYPSDETTQATYAQSHQSQLGKVSLIRTHPSTAGNDAYLASYKAELVPVAAAKAWPEKLVQAFNHAKLIRVQLAQMPFRVVPLRVVPSGALLERFKAEGQKIREAYLTHGSAAATALLQQGVNGYYRRSYREWMNLGAPPAPFLEA